MRALLLTVLVLVGVVLAADKKEAKPDLAKLKTTYEAAEKAYTDAKDKLLAPAEKDKTVTGAKDADAKAKALAAAQKAIMDDKKNKDAVAALDKLKKTADEAKAAYEKAGGKVDDKKSTTDDKKKAGDDKKAGDKKAAAAPKKCVTDDLTFTL